MDTGHENMERERNPDVYLRDIVCPVCWGSGWNVDTCSLCDALPGGAVGVGTLPATQESVIRMFRWFTATMGNMEHQGPSEKLTVPLGWDNGEYMVFRSENARRMLVGVEAMLVMAHATALADELKEREMQVVPGQ